MKAYISDAERMALVEFYDFELANGETVKLTSNFWALSKLRAANPEAYKKYNELVSKTAQTDFVDMAYILYYAYLCACNLLEVEEITDEETFIAACGNDLVAVGDLYGKLIAPKKK